MLNWTEKELIELKSHTMRRVWRVWFFRRVFIPAGLVLALSGFILVRELSRVHVGIIFSNVLGRLANLELLGLANYFFVAVQKTELDSLLIMASSTLLALFFGRRLIRETLFLATRKTSTSLLK